MVCLAGNKRTEESCSWSRLISGGIDTGGGEYFLSYVTLLALFIEENAFIVIGRGVVTIKLSRYEIH